MSSRIETYRVSAYNTAKQSENKMHDDTVAKRFGFSGGLVPGVDVMAYMMHMPVARWGRAFLEHGLIDARFVKPVYDGEDADVTAEENNGVLAIEVKSRGDSLRDRQRHLAGLAAVVLARRLSRGVGGRRAQARQRVVLRSRQVAGHHAAAMGGRGCHRNISPTSGRPIRSLPAKGSAIPA